MDAPLVSLFEDYGVASGLPEWPVVYVGDDAPRHVPPEVRAAGSVYRHVCWYKPGDCQFWWQASSNGRDWIYVLRTG